MPTTKNRGSTVARPKKQRCVDGIALAENLYPANRPNYWRYLRPDGTFKYFTAVGADKANKIAAYNNARRDQMPAAKQKNNTGRDQLSYWVPLYTAYRERLDPKLPVKNSWQNRKGALKAMGESLDNTPVGRITHDIISGWWEQLTHHQQKQRHAECRKLFNWLMGQGLLPRLDYNPFTTADDRPRLYLSGKAEKSRLPLTIDEFWKTYDAAGKLKYDCLQIAMGISLTTFMRESDICGLIIDEHLRDNLLQRVIGKSAAQRGTAKAARLSWNQTNYELLRQLIARGMALSLKNQRCPYLISHQPKQKRRGKTKTHTHQVTPRRLISMFAEARKLANVHTDCPEGRSPATFHEIRGLASAMAAKSGYKLEQIQRAMAHGDPNTTRGYQNEHDLPYDAVPITLTVDVLGRDFA